MNTHAAELTDGGYRVDYVADQPLTPPPQGLPLVPQAARPYLEALTHGAEKATQAEIDANPRSAPVRLRAAVRTRPACDAPASQTGQERCRYGDRGTQHGRRRPAASARSRSRHTGRS